MGDGVESLPATVVDGKIVMTKKYPTNAEISNCLVKVFLVKKKTKIGSVRLGVVEDFDVIPLTKYVFYKGKSLCSYRDGKRVLAADPFQSSRVFYRSSKGVKEFPVVKP